MSAERTLPASSRKRQTLRADGQIPVSVTMGSAAGLLMVALLLQYRGSVIAGGLAEMLQHELSQDPHQELTVLSVTTHVRAIAVALLGAVASFAVPIWLVAWMQGLLQTRFNLTWKPLAWQWQRLNPFAGLQQILGGAAWLRGVNLLLQLITAGLLLWGLVSPSLLHEFDGGSQEGVMSFLQQWSRSLTGIAMRFSVVSVVLAIIDYALQRSRFERQIQMTVQELREEIRQDEGNGRHFQRKVV